MLFTDSMRRNGVLFSAVLFSLFVSACATLPLPSTGTEVFAASGRFSVVAEPNESLSGRFGWVETTQGSDITLSSPLGNTLARLVVRPERSVLTLGSGSSFETSTESQTAAQPEALLERYLKVSLPVSGLKYWLQGSSTLGIPQAPNSFSEDGWQIRYPQMQDGKPRLIQLSREGQGPTIQIKLFVEEWRRF